MAWAIIAAYPVARSEIHKNSQLFLPQEPWSHSSSELADDSRYLDYFLKPNVSPVTTTLPRPKLFQLKFNSPSNQLV